MRQAGPGPAAARTARTLAAAPPGPSAPAPGTRAPGRPPSPSTPRPRTRPPAPAASGGAAPPSVEAEVCEARSFVRLRATQVATERAARCRECRHCACLHSLARPVDPLASHHNQRHPHNSHSSSAPHSAPPPPPVPQSSSTAPSTWRSASKIPTPADTARLRERTRSRRMGMRTTPPDAAHAACASGGRPLVSAPNSSQSPGRYVPSAAWWRVPCLLNPISRPPASEAAASNAGQSACTATATLSQ